MIAAGRRLPNRKKPNRAAGLSLSTSRYAFAIPIDDAVLIYSARTGAVVRLQGRDAPSLAARLTGAPGRLQTGTFPMHLLKDLLRAGLLLPNGFDELRHIKDTYWEARRSTPMCLTVTTTMDCNLGCYYCYEERSGARLDESDVDSLITFTESRLLQSGKRSLHVDWYGGEPLLNPEALERASRGLQSLCLRLDVVYSASIISNGTLWPDDIGAFVRAHAIRQAQISFDGLVRNHEKRRRYRAGQRPAEGASTFDLAVSVVDRLLDHTRVDVRFNIDRSNVGDLEGFIRMMRHRGWFDKPFPVVFQPARLSAYSDRSAFMRRVELSAEDYDGIRARVRRLIDGAIGVEESEVPDGFPFPRNSVCAALADDSVVVGADGALFRCGLQVSEPDRAVGQLPRPNYSGRSLPVYGAKETDAAWWKEFDPTAAPSCSRCSFLPVCWGGCPKKHLEKDTHALDEQSEYWRRNLARLVTQGLGIALSGPQVFSAQDQFRG